ncbi:MAG: tRNA (adenosine(37)-N6)-threonylcarbamoyltransferase complex ATPase subunit type 1 TsaE [Holophagales bacterium]|jgi:tRNA threonylcarbamoyladenosine biosynthesis protein TsaE|nr:tRNA (adenosine(37)-N6)-threonylcarbamoyltransferase complex ATPase subunit type 1 TsaE [Holophagales bacterium]
MRDCDHMECELYLADEQATENLGAVLAKQTPQGGTWLLNGGLGAGKTTWTRGFVAGLGGCAEQVSSPTYAVLHRYDAPKGKVFHLDLYRLGTSGVWSLGLEECVTQGDWLVVEWAGVDGPWASDWVSFLELSQVSDGRNAAWRGAIVEKT